MLSNDRGKLRSAQTLYIEENKRLADLKCRKKVVHQKEYFEDVLKSSDSLSVDEAVYGNERGDWIKTFICHSVFHWVLHYSSFSCH